MSTFPLSCCLDADNLAKELGEVLAQGSSSSRQLVDELYSQKFLSEELGKKLQEVQDESKEAILRLEVLF